MSKQTKAKVFEALDAKVIEIKLEGKLNDFLMGLILTLVKNDRTGSQMH